MFSRTIFLKIMLRDALSINLENPYLVCSFVESRNNSSIDTEYKSETRLDTVYYLALN